MVLGWTGIEVRALRQARRMTVREFAAHLGVSDRIVSRWEAAGARTNLRPVNQHALDTSLALAPVQVRERFAALLPEQRQGPSEREWHGNDHDSRRPG